jgi:hypothetical protein
MILETTCARARGDSGILRHDDDMKELIENVASELQAVRNFQELSVHDEG